MSVVRITPEEYFKEEEGLQPPTQRVVHYYITQPNNDKIIIIALIIALIIAFLAFLAFLASRERK